MLQVKFYSFCYVKPNITYVKQPYLYLFSISQYRKKVATWATFKIPYNTDFSVVYQPAIHLHMAHTWSFSVAPQLASLRIWLIRLIFKVSAHLINFRY